MPTPVSFPRPWKRQPQYLTPLKDPGFWRLVDVQTHPVIGTGITRTLNNTARRGHGMAGPCVEFPTAGDYIDYGTNPTLQLSTMSGLAVLEVPSTSTDCAIFNTRVAGAGSGGFVIYVTNTGAIQITKLDVTLVILTTAKVRKGKGISAVAWSYNNVTGKARVAIDGVLQSATVVVTFTHGLVARNKYYTGSATVAAPHKQYLFALSPFDQVSNAQLIAWSLNPWSIYAPRDTQIWLPDAVPGGGTVIPVFANHYRNQGIM